MGKNTNIIEINGKRYDAVTGAAVGDQGDMKVHRHLDGIIAPSDRAPVIVKPSTGSQPAQNQTGPNQTHRAPSPPSRLSMHDVVRPTTHRPARSPQPARTLMRRGVSKPLAESRPRLKAQGRTDELLQRPTLDIGTKLSASSIDNRRLKHARVVPKSRLISRYNLDSITAVSTSTQRQVVHRQPTPVVSRSHRPASGRVTTTADLLQHAIEQANSHRQAPPKTRPVSTRHHTRIVSVSTLALAAILLFGFVLHQDMPNIKLDLASSRAGFAASLPADQPAGFSLNGLSAVTGQVALHFRSNSDTSRNYTITEKPSQWNSATLRDMFVIEASNDSYQAVQVAGRTAYIYGQQDITWVSGGIWYEIHSNGALSNQQLTDIAASV